MLSWLPHNLCIRGFPISHIFGFPNWSNCSLINRAKLDNDARLLDFTEKLEAACIGAVESGKMTKDLALIIHGSK